MTSVAPDTHGILDYVLIVLLALGPSMFALTGTPAVLCYGFVVGLFLLTLLTDYPFGVSPVAPPKVHRAVEAVMAVLFLGLPWVSGFASDTRALWFFIGAAAYLGVVWLLTEHHAAQPTTGPASIPKRA